MKCFRKLSVHDSQRLYSTTSYLNPSLRELRIFRLKMKEPFCWSFLTLLVYLCGEGPIYFFWIDISLPLQGKKRLERKQREQRYSLSNKIKVVKATHKLFLYFLLISQNLKKVESLHSCMLVICLHSSMLTFLLFYLFIYLFIYLFFYILRAK